MPTWRRGFSSASSDRRLARLRPSIRRAVRTSSAPAQALAAAPPRIAYGRDRDATGSAKVETDAHRLPAGRPFDDKAQVELLGEFDKDFRSAEVEMDEVRFLR